MLLTSLLIAGLMATGSSPVWAGSGYTGVEGAFFLSGFDAANKSGQLLAADTAGETSVVVEYPGRYLAELHPLEVEGGKGLFLLWKGIPETARSYPEIWVDTEESEGPQKVWPAGDTSWSWWEATVAVRRKNGETLLQVQRSLIGENRTQPLLRKRERYRLTPAGPHLVKERFADVRTPDQRLNRIADQLEFARWDAALSDIRQLDGEARGISERASIQLSYLPAEAAGRRIVRRRLDEIAMGGGPIAENAVRRLIELARDGTPLVPDYVRPTAIEPSNGYAE